MVFSYPGSTKIEQKDVKGKKEKEKKRNHGFVNSYVSPALDVSKSGEGGSLGEDGIWVDR